MKRLLLLVVVAVVGCSLLWALAAKHQAARDAVQLAAHQADWDKEKTDLEETIGRLQDAARKAAEAPPTVQQPPPAQIVVPSVKAPTPAEIIERLKNAKNGSPTRTVRLAIQQLENLIQTGTNAIPAIREFLAQNQDIAYGASGSRGSRTATDFVAPPTLRVGLFDALKQIGGPQAQAALAEALQTATNGQEIAYLSAVLQGIAPDQYRDTALAAARQLLAAGNLDRNQRDTLYGVLAANKDTSLVPQAQAALIQADGQIDRSALRYLQQSLGDQAVPIAAAAYNDSRVAPDNKENLAKIGLYYAGVNQQANQFYDTAIRDESLPLDARAGLVKDLGQDGLNERNPSATVDLPIIQARLDMIQSYKGGADDPRLQAAFAEAQKDLLRLRARVTQKSSP
jgi:hypothetical protein